jgi:hypothetical protein
MPTLSTIPFPSDVSPPPGASYPDDFPPPSPPSGLFTQENVRAPYGNYEILVSYEGDTGVLQLPVAGPGPQTPSEIVRVAAPWMRKVVTWAAWRDVDWPVLPHPAPRDSNLVLKTWRLVPRAPKVLPDGVFRRFRVEGEYLYYLTVPLLPGDPLPTAAAPYETTPLDANLLQPYLFAQGII